MAFDNDDNKDRIRRSIQQEFVRMEDDFDETRSIRKRIINKLVDTVDQIKLVDDNGIPKEDNASVMDVVKTTLKALSDAEKSTATAISLKLKNQEQAIASAAAAKDRIAIVLKATAPGRIEQEFPEQDLEAHLSDMFDAEIKDFELKANPRDLSE
jgi:predicted DNA-binding protein (UPF0251 family)